MPFVHKQLDGQERFGRDLRELRELRGFTREELSSKTKIHASVIAALEEERVDDLSDPLYAERHVRALALALEGRPGYFLKKYRDLLEQRNAVRPEEASVRKIVGWRDLFVPSKALAATGFALLALLAAGYLAWQGRVLQEPPRLILDYPADGEQLTDPYLEVRGRTNKGAKVKVNGRSAVVEKDGSFFVSFDVPRGVTTVTVEAKRRYGPLAEKILRVSYERR